MKNESSQIALMKAFAAGATVLCLSLIIFILHVRFVESDVQESVDQLKGVLYKSPPTGMKDSDVIFNAMSLIKDSDILRSFTTDAPYAILAKRYDSECGCFRIALYNKEFKKIFLDKNNIAAGTYMNSTERENWPDSLAEIYENQDFRALREGRVLEFNADFMDGDTIRRGRFKKWSDGKEYLFMVYLVENKE